MSRVPAWLAASARLLAFVVAAACAAKAWALLDASEHNFDAAMGWDAVALLLLAAIALPAVRIDGARLRGVGGWAAAHRVELALLGLVLAAGVFMRLYGFGTLPATHGTGLEENQTGGLAWRILNSGKRPLEFAFTDYTAALGFSVFGYTPDGMRLPFLIFGTASLVPLYVLLRLLVSAPAALFATALLAVCRWQALSVRFADELFFGANLTILAALLLVVVLKTRSRLAVLGLALLTGALNYEYVSYRHLPFLIAAALLVALAIAVRRRVVESGDIWASITQTARAYATPMAIFVLGVFIVVTPLAVVQLNGDNVYLEAFQRHTAAEPNRAVFGLLPDDWTEKTRDTVEVFLPAGPKNYPEVLPLFPRGQRILDPVTALFAIGAAVYVVATWRRPIRAFFGAWLLVGLLVGGIVPENFYAGRFTGLLPPLFVLIAFAVDDLLRLAERFDRAQALRYAFVPLALVAFAFNLHGLDLQKSNPKVIAELANPIYDVCRFMRRLEPDTYVYVAATTEETPSIFEAGDYDWACRGLTGQALDSLAATWPAPAPAGSKVAFVLLTRSDDENDPAAWLRAAYPGGREVRGDAYAGYELRAYVIDRDAMLARQQLVLASTGASVTFRGLVRLRVAGQVALAPTSALAGRVVIDGAEVYASDGSAASLRPQLLIAGWHVIELTLPAGVAPDLTWLDSSGAVVGHAAEDDFFAADARRGWLHETTARLSTGAELTWQGVVAYPAFSAIEIQAPPWLLPPSNDEAATPAAATPQRESWRTTWRVDAGGSYRLHLKIGAGAATLTLDGVPVLQIDQGAILTETQLNVTAGDHALVLDVDERAGGVFGAKLDIEGPSDGGAFLLP